MAKCAHDWKECITPPDGAYPWFRCVKCGVFVYKRGRKLIAYRCQVQRCAEPATTRLPGRGPRASYRWRCKGHEHRESIVVAKPT